MSSLSLSSSGSQEVDVEEAIRLDDLDDQFKRREVIPYALIERLGLVPETLRKLGNMYPENFGLWGSFDTLMKELKRQFEIASQCEELYVKMANNAEEIIEQAVEETRYPGITELLDKYERNNVMWAFKHFPHQPTKIALSLEVLYDARNIFGRLELPPELKAQLFGDLNPEAVEAVRKFLISSEIIRPLNPNDPNLEYLPMEIMTWTQGISKLSKSFDINDVETLATVLQLTRNRITGMSLPRAKGFLQIAQEMGFAMTPGALRELAAAINMNEIPEIN